MECSYSNKVEVIEGVRLKASDLGYVKLCRAFIKEAYDCLDPVVIKKGNMFKKLTNYIEVKYFLANNFDLVCGNSLVLNDIPRKAIQNRLDQTRNDIYKEVLDYYQTSKIKHERYLKQSKKAQIQRYIDSNLTEMVSYFLFGNSQNIKKEYKKLGLIRGKNV